MKTNHAATSKTEAQNNDDVTRTKVNIALGFTVTPNIRSRYY